MKSRTKIEGINITIFCIILVGYGMFFFYTRGYIILAACCAIFFFQGLALSYAFLIAAILKYVLKIRDGFTEEKRRVDTTRIGIAKLYLTLLQEGQEREPEYRVTLLLDEAKKGNFKLKDIGTSQEELDVLVAECHYNAALHYLRRLRNVPVGQEHPIIYPLYVDALLHAIKHGNIPLKKLATNEKEILSFQMKAVQHKTGT